MCGNFELVGAVNASRLVEVIGDALETGGKLTMIERVSRPDIRKRQRMERGFRRREPLDLEVNDMERHQHAVDHAIGIQKQPPDDGDDHRREEPGHKCREPAGCS